MSDKISSTLLLAPEKKGMRVNGVRYLRQSKGVGYADMRRMMAAHLEDLAREYYAGNITIVDEFLQLYCIVDDLAQVDLALSSYVAPPQTSERNALKDPIDCLRYCLKDDFGYLDAGQLRGRRGTFY